MTQRWCAFKIQEIYLIDKWWLDFLHFCMHNFSMMTLKKWKVFHKKKGSSLNIRIQIEIRIPVLCMNSFWTKADCALLSLLYTFYFFGFWLLRKRTLYYSVRQRSSRWLNNKWALNLKPKHYVSYVLDEAVYRIRPACMCEKGFPMFNIVCWHLSSVFFFLPENRSELINGNFVVTCQYA